MHNILSIYNTIFNGAKRGLPYPTADLLLLFDGTIIDVEGIKYFVDKKQGKNFLITNYDFPDDWTKGFPYKSAATISAPVGDAELIAADFNNFLYDSGGTPNEIHVVSLFQDIDYEHRFFCKHAAQILNSNGVEIYEPRVLRWNFYSTVQADNNLTQLNNYFNVPTENANAVWVDASVAVTGDGSKESPFKTFREGYLDAFASQYPAYLKTGEYVRGGTLNSFLEAFGIARSIFKDTVSPVILTGGNNQKYRGFIIDGSSSANYGIQTASSSVEVSKCYIKNTASYNYYNGAGTSGNVINKSIFGHSFLQANTSYIDTCYFNETLRSIVGNADTTKRTVTFINSRLNINLTAQSATTRYLFELRGNLAITVKGCSASTSVIRGWFGRQALGTNNDNQLTFEYNICEDYLNDNNLYYLRLAETANQLFTDIQINDNKFIMNDDLLYSTIRIEGNNVANIYNNKITTKGTSEGGGVNILNINTSVNIYNNYINIREGAAAISIGDEVTQYSFACNIYNNNTFGPREQSDYLSGAHMVFTRRVPDAKGYRNRIKGANLGIVRKGTGDNNTSAYEIYNIVHNCGGSLLSKGQRNVMFYNNTVVNDGTYPTTLNFYGAQVQNSDGGVLEDASGCKFKNNIIVDKAEYTGGAVGYLCIINDAESEVNVEFDYNIYYSLRQKPFLYLGVEKTFAEWQALGYDANSIFLTENQFNNLFNDFDNGDFSLKTGSQAIGNGIDLGATYKTGLDASTDWGDENTIPSVVTKDQIGSWNIGAYIS